MADSLIGAQPVNLTPATSSLTRGCASEATEVPLEAQSSCSPPCHWQIARPCPCSHIIYLYHLTSTRAVRGAEPVMQQAPRKGLCPTAPLCWHKALILGSHGDACCWCCRVSMVRQSHRWRLCVAALCHGHVVLVHA
eukprot:1160989-Pelagomonas_calceolata.AAC.15